MQTAQQTIERNLELMQTLDDAWNTQNWEVFRKRHTRDVAVHWPGQPTPTRGRDPHQTESEAFFKTFPDNHIDNRPYKTLFGYGDWTCSVANFTGTMKGPLTMPDGSSLPPTNKRFQVEFCTVAHWKDGEITDERLFYDQGSLMAQIGYPLSPTTR
jgi:hypothetical protein